MSVCHAVHAWEVGGQLVGTVFSSYLPWVLGIKPESLCLCGKWLDGLNLLPGHRHAVIEPFHSARHALGIC